MLFYNHTLQKYQDDSIFAEERNKAKVKVNLSGYHLIAASLARRSMKQQSDVCRIEILFTKTRQKTVGLQIHPIHCVRNAKG